MWVYNGPIKFNLANLIKHKSATIISKWDCLVLVRDVPEKNDIRKLKGENSVGKEKSKNPGQTATKTRTNWPR